MILWIVFALMTAAAIVAVLWPLGHGPGAARGGSDLLVYKDQLQEIDRDRASGLIGEAEAEAARLEISRRLLSAADADKAAAMEAPAPVKSRHRRMAALAVLVVLALGPLGLYVALGSPNIPAQPAFARVDKPPGGQSIYALVSEVEAHLASNPNDGRGWEVLAPVYMRLGRFDDAVAARRKALGLGGETAARRADLGEALAAAADGVVTAEAKTEFDRAVALDAHDTKARYFLGLAAEQDGNKAKAAAIWRALLDDSPPGAPWVTFVRAALAHATGTPAEPPPNANTGGNDSAAAAPEPGPSAKDVAAAETLSEDQRRDMVRGMVTRLADRLHHAGADVEGWLRLVRAYVVLGDRDKAKEAAADAKRALADHADETKRIDDLVKGLGLDG